MKANRKHLVAAAVAMALSSSAYAGTTFFSTTGSGVANANVSIFDWAPDNLLVLNTTPAGELSAGATITVVAQGQLSALLGPLIPALGTNTFTYQMKTFLEFNAGASTATNLVYDAPDPVIAGTFFEIYWNPADIASQTTGCGYGAHQSAFCPAAPLQKKILSGSAVMQKGTSTTLVQTDLKQPHNLDDFDVPSDNSKGVNTQNLKLSDITLDVNVLSFDAAFFVGIVTSLSVDITHRENGAAPFTSATPSDEVLGSAGDGAVTKRAAADRDLYFGTDALNDIGDTSCAGGGGGDDVCGVQLESDSRSTVNGFVPEPHSLALLGLGLAGLGWSARRRRAKPAAV